MVDRINMLAAPGAKSGLALGLLAGFLFGATCPALSAEPARAAPPATLVEPRAHVVRVDRSYIAPMTSPLSGAGVRAFQPPGDTPSGTERFDIHWYANPPGIPPGVVLLLESIPEHGATIKNHMVRIPTKSEGHLHSVIEIPSREIRQAGRVREWRLRLIFRSALLAQETSPGWEG